jgi:hypothetical protein
MTSTALGRSFLVMGTYVLGSMLGGSSQAADHHHHHRSVPDAAPPLQSVTVRSEAALRDQVHDLPGLEYKPKFDMFAGYLDPVATRHVL